MLNLDSHMIVFLLAGELTPTELRHLEGQDLAISDIVLWEISKLVQLQRLELDLRSEPFQSLLANLTVIPITLAIALSSTRLDFRGDPADEIIGATSLVEKIPLLTRDRKIRKSKLIPIAL